jgi:hypothetical protein
MSCDFCVFALYSPSRSSFASAWLRQAHN